MIDDFYSLNGDTHASALAEKAVVTHSLTFPSPSLTFPHSMME